MDILTTDFETYYGKGYTLSSMSTESYLRDPRFEVNICGFKLNEQPSFWLLPERTHQFLTEEIDWANTAVLCHHAHFDAAILAWKYGVRPVMILDTLPMSRIVNGAKAKHDLETLMLKHGLGQKRTDVLKMAWGKRLNDFNRDELRWYGQYCTEDCDGTYALAQLYLPQLTQLQLDLIDMKTRMFTEPVFQGDIGLLAQAVADEITRKEAMLLRCGYDKKLFSSSDKFAAILREWGIEPPTKYGKPTIDANGREVPKVIYAFAKTDPGMQSLLEDQDEDIRFLAQTRLEMKSTIIQTRAQRFLDCATRGPMPVYIKVNGTHTQRASAGDGMNWMNLTSVNKLRPEMTVIKRSIQAPEGCKVVSADSSQIQFRLTAWLAGQEDLLQAFEQGRDVYSETASEIYQRPVDRKKNPVDDFVAGQVGKISDLSFCFQKGWYGAAVDFLKGHLGAPPIQFTMKDAAAMGVDVQQFCNNPKKVDLVDKMPSRLDLNDRLVHCAITESIVTRWRARRHKIAKKGGLWETMEGVINAMMRGERVHFGPRGVLYTEKECIVAPSGAKLSYSGLQRSADGEATYWDGRSRVHIYGGSLTNNTVQLLEQEVVGQQMLEVHEAGYKVAVECYDNIVVVVPKEYAEACLAFMLKTMKTRPAWGQDLPITAEGGIGTTWYEAKEG